MWHQQPLETTMVTLESSCLTFAIYKYQRLIRIQADLVRWGHATEMRWTPTQCSKENKRNPGKYMQIRQFDRGVRWVWQTLFKQPGPGWKPKAGDSSKTCFQQPRRVESLKSVSLALYYAEYVIPI